MRYNDIRCNNYLSKKINCSSAARRSQQFGELPQALRARGGPIVPDEPPAPARRAGPGASAPPRVIRAITVRRSFVFAAARNQAALLQAVEQAGNVRVSGNHAAGDLAARKPFGRAAQDSQHVVLRRRELLALETWTIARLACRWCAASRGRPPLRASRPADSPRSRLAFALHTLHSIRYNDYCQDAHFLRLPLSPPDCLLGGPVDAGTQAQQSPGDRTIVPGL